MKLTSNIKIQVWDIVVGDMYYSFKYKANQDGKITIGDYDSSHDRIMDKDVFRKELEDRGAFQIVMERI